MSSYLKIRAVFCKLLLFATRTAKTDARKFWHQ